MLYLVIHAGMKVMHCIKKKQKKTPKQQKHNPRYRVMYIFFTMVAVFKAFVKHRRKQHIVYISVSF